jgi:hypothetical protein
MQGAYSGDESPEKLGCGIDSDSAALIIVAETNQRGAV